MGGIKATAYMISALAAVPVLPIPEARAAMGAADIMASLHPKHKGQLTMDEARDAAARRYDVIAKAHGGTVTLLQLGGRVTPADLKAAKIGDGEDDEAISKEDYVALAERFFAAANVSRKPDVSPADGTLSLAEMSTPAGAKLVRLLE